MMFNVIGKLFVFGVCAVALTSKGASLPSETAAEIVRGFRASTGCIRGDLLPVQWCDDFQTMLREHALVRDDSIAFRLGANFGFSFRAEPAAEGAATSAEELRWVAEHTALARLDFEDAKKVLNLVDSDVIQLLRINPHQFSEWKVRVITNDNGTSERSPGHGIAL